MFKVYDAQTDEFLVSRRWATTDAITRARGQAIEGSAREIDASDLEPAVEGMTPRGSKIRER